MILILGSSICAASQSVETSGSSVEDVMVRISGVSQSSLPDLIRQSVGLEAMDTRVKPACDEVLPLRLLRLVLLDRSAGIAPGGETAAHMSDRLQPHVLRGFGRQHRTQSASAMKDEL